MSIENVRLVAKANAVTLDWLLTGEGPMMKARLNQNDARHLRALHSQGIQRGNQPAGNSLIATLRHAKFCYRIATVYRSKTACKRPPAPSEIKQLHIPKEG